MDRIECSVCADERVQLKNFFVEYLNIIPVNYFKEFTADRIPLCPKHCDCVLSLPPKISVTLKFNRQQLKDSCKFMGIKPHECSSVSNRIFSLLCDMVRSMNKLKDQEAPKPLKAVTVSITNEGFYRYVQEALDKYEYWSSQHLCDFKIATEVVSKKRNVIVLLGGASGTGKSSLASLLASRLGISSTLSTDSIRHIVRNFIAREEKPVLFCSTYEAGQYIDNSGLTQKQALLQGYRQQCELVYEYLLQVIQNIAHCNESIVVEGVHLTVSIMKKLMRQFKSCIPFVIFIKKGKKHMERFAVRSKYMTLDPSANKYVNNFKNIREIQKKFIKNADESLIPKLNNNNLDRSLGLAHATLVRCLRKLHSCTDLRSQTIFLNQEFNFVSGSILSSDHAQQLIKAKVSKGELFKRFFKSQQLAEEFDLQEQAECEEQSNESESEAPDIGSIVSSGMDINDKLRKRPEVKTANLSPPRSVPSEDEISDSMNVDSPSSGPSNESEGSLHEENKGLEKCVN